ncbi:hypothetical protein Vadar_006922 [Vaccinium darrowii]|uniref:Uncharacterized protein n=1 Tax=Vaccinium darrowii TaxID=229202 RepID=A0ACB7YD72_9ERIC|nr:hypothetical protein Vadar_006922 [Vaccinium darrowii]
MNLSAVRSRMDSLQRFLSDSVNENRLIGKDQMEMVSTEISSAIHQIIVNGAALLASTAQISPANRSSDLKFLPDVEMKPSVSAVNRNPVFKDTIADLKVPGVGDTLHEPRLFLDDQSQCPLAKGPTATDLKVPGNLSDVELKTPISSIKRIPRVDTTKDVKVPCNLGDFETKSPMDLSTSSGVKGVVEMKVEEEEIMKEEIIQNEDWDIIELDSVELLAEHIHFCDICGKGFKRDANLRMHMRAHGNQFKTPEALAKPDRSLCEVDNRRNKATRFSCPFSGCNRNKLHKKFRPLKSVICVKNHFKRSHCPKMYSCNRCNKKSFSVVADLKSHLKHCGESKWKCTCGTTFSRKDKLFGHMALFEGHMPAVVEDEGKGAVAVAAAAVEDEDDDDQMREVEIGENGFFEGLLDGFDSIEGYCLQDVLGSPNGFGLGATGNDFFNF